MKIVYNDAYEKLRKPMPQILGGTILLGDLGGTCQYLFGLKISTTPLYLIISTVLGLVVVVACFCILFFKEPENHEAMKRNARIFLFIDVLAMIFVLSAFYNVYFFMAAQNGVDLSIYWYIGFFTMLVCILALCCSMILLYFTPDWLKGNNEKEKKENKLIYIISLLGISMLTFVEKYIEYLLIPNINESKFIYFHLITMILGSYVVFAMMYIHYTQVLADYELENADWFFDE